MPEHGVSAPDQDSTTHAQLRLVTGLLEKHGLTHWLDCGTLLGVVRDGGPIPGDKDVDIGIWEHDLPALQRLAPRFEEIGYRMYGFQYNGWTYGVNVRDRQENDAVVSFGVYGRHGRFAWRMASYMAPNPYPPGSPGFFIKGLFRYPVRRRATKLRTRRDIGQLARTWPYSRIVKIATWWVPLHLLDPVRPLAGSKYLGPADPEGLLSAHYGDWRRRVNDYIWWRDDRLVVHNTPAQLIAKHSPYSQRSTRSTAGRRTDA